MRSFVVLAAQIAVAVGSIVAAPAWGAPDPPGLVRIDENADGSIQLGSRLVPLVAHSGTGVTYQILRGFTAFDPGAVFVTDPATGGVSDLLLFEALSEDPTGIFDLSVAVYSDMSDLDPALALADVAAFPPIGGFLPLLLPETIFADGSSGLSYTPSIGQPGYGVLPDGSAFSYRFVSDVPEPASLALLGAGTALLGLHRRRAA